MSPLRVRKPSLLAALLVALAIPLGLARTPNASAEVAGQSDAELRTRYFAAIDELQAGQAAEALHHLEALNQDLGRPTARVQAALIRAAAATHQDERVLREFTVWQSLGLPQDEAHRELDALRGAAQTRVDAVLATRRRDENERAAARQRAEAEARVRREAILGRAERRVAIAGRSTLVRDSDQAVKEARSAMAAYPTEPRARLLGLQIPLLEARIVLLQEKLEAEQRARAAAISTRYRLAADEESHKANNLYALGTMWLVLGLGSGAAAVWWVHEEPLGDGSLSVIVPGALLAGLSGASLMWSYSDFGTAGIRARSAESLRRRAEVGWMILHSPAGATFALAGAF